MDNRVPLQTRVCWTLWAAQAAQKVAHLNEEGGDQQDELVPDDEPRQAICCAAPSVADVL